MPHLISVLTGCPGRDDPCWMFKTDGENYSFLLNGERYWIRSHQLEESQRHYSPCTLVRFFRTLWHLVLISSSIEVWNPEVSVAILLFSAHAKEVAEENFWQHKTAGSSSPFTSK